MNRNFGLVKIVDLNSGTTRDWQIDDDICRLFVGGAGLAGWIYKEMAKGNVDSLDPASPFIALTGPLTGTSVFLSGRHSFAGRSPLTGFWGEASIGGTWGRELRKTGYDGLVLLGRADRPVYLYLDDDQLKIVEAEDLWGLDTFETNDRLQAKTGAGSVCCIGPAGERLVKFAGLFTDGAHARTAARCGLGALLGAKNVKAIAVKGSKTIPVADQKALKQEIKEMMGDFTGRLKGMSDFGTPGLVIPCESLGDLPINNWRQGKWTVEAQKISGPALKEKYLKKKYFCAGCVVGCGRTVAGVLDDQREETGGPEYETLAMLGSKCLIEDLEAIIRLNELCNRWGIDTIDAGAAVALTMELFEHGLLTAEDLGGLEVNWGDATATEKLLEKIVQREDFGDILAEGVGKAAEKVGGLASECSIQAHNMALPAHDPRAYSSIALGYSTSTRGPCHCNAFSHIFERATTFPEVGVDEVLDRFASSGKAEMVIGAQHVMHLWDSLALCKFSVFGGIRLHHLSRWLKYAAGWDLTVEDLKKSGERIFNFKRKLNADWGWSRKDDVLPGRVLTQRVSDGGAGDHLPPLNVMLADYYQARGWTDEGLPGENTLKRLDIE